MIGDIVGRSWSPPGALSGVGAVTVSIKICVIEKQTKKLGPEK